MGLYSLPNMSFEENGRWHGSHVIVCRAWWTPIRPNCAVNIAAKPIPNMSACCALRYLRVAAALASRPVSKGDLYKALKATLLLAVCIADWPGSVAMQLDGRDDGGVPDSHSRRTSYCSCLSGVTRICQITC